jgi:hypothetical protein
MKKLKVGKKILKSLRFPQYCRTSEQKGLKAYVGFGMYKKLADEKIHRCHKAVIVLVLKMRNVEEFEFKM